MLVLMCIITLVLRQKCTHILSDARELDRVSTTE